MSEVSRAYDRGRADEQSSIAQWEMRARTAEMEVMRRPTVTEMNDAVAAERERCAKEVERLRADNASLTAEVMHLRELVAQRARAAAIRKGE